MCLRVHGSRQRIDGLADIILRQGGIIGFEIADSIERIVFAAGGEDIAAEVGAAAAHEVGGRVEDAAVYADLIVDSGDGRGRRRPWSRRSGCCRSHCRCVRHGCRWRLRFCMIPAGGRIRTSNEQSCILRIEYNEGRFADLGFWWPCPSRFGFNRFMRLRNGHCT